MKIWKRVFSSAISCTLCRKLLEVTQHGQNFLAAGTGAAGTSASSYTDLHNFFHLSQTGRRRGCQRCSRALPCESRRREPQCRLSHRPTSPVQPHDHSDDDEEAEAEVQAPTVFTTMITPMPPAVTDSSSNVAALKVMNKTAAIHRSCRTQER